MPPDMHQILSNPAKVSSANRAGINHVVQRMDWYCVLTGHLLNRENANEYLKPVLQKLERKVVALYEAILLYQMKSVYSYYRNKVIRFIRALAILDDWDGDVWSVKTAEEALLNDWESCNKIMEHYGR